MNQLTRFNWMTLAFSVTALIGPGISQTKAQEVPVCPDLTHDLPPTIDPLVADWSPLYQIGSGPERVALVVWEDLTLPGADRLYDNLQSSIDTYAADVAAAGFTVAVIKFYGMAEDPVNPGAPDLRWQLRAMYDDTVGGSLAGAVLVGDVPYLLFERNPVGESAYDFAADSLIGDLDAKIVDNKDESYSPGEWRAGVFDTWDTSECLNEEMEIWTSRIMARAELAAYFGQTQEQILTTYFARNHTDRWNAFNSSGEALVYGLQGCCWPGVGALEGLFGASNVVVVCPETGTPTSADYLETQLPHGYAHIHLQSTHGCQTTQFYTDVTRLHYTFQDVYPLSADPQTMSFVFAPCRNANFAYEEACIAEVVVFNPEAPTLVVLGPSGDMGGDCAEDYYGVLPEGRCLGEGLKRLINNHPSYPLDNNSYVLLGDGTLKRWGETVEWVSDGSSLLWNDDDNWSTGQEPMPTDNVLHNNANDIHMNIGTFNEPTAVMGFEGDGTLGGALWILADKHLELGGDAVLKYGYQVALEEALHPTSQTKLTVKGDILGGDFTLNAKTWLDVETGDLSNATIDMPGSAFWTTTLDVAGAIENCPSVYVGQNGDVTAAAIDNCEQVDVMAAGSITAGQITNCDVNVASDGVVSAGDIDGCRFEVFQNASVTATGGIEGVPGGSTDQSWTIVGGTVVAEDSSTLRDDWTMQGGTATFHEMSASDQVGIWMDLSGGANLAVEHLPPPLHPENLRSPFPDAVAHQLIYRAGDNQFGGGQAEDIVVDQMYFGTQTRILSGGEEDPSLTLDLRCELHIASDFREAFVHSGWDTRDADIIAQPVFQPEDGTQAIELITPAFAVWYADPFSFLDVPCHGAFRDLTLPPASGAPPVATTMRNMYDNSELGWPTARGLFRNVTVGANRTLEFYSNDGVIHFHGEAQVDPAATVKLDGQSVAWQQVIIQVPGTIFGDWNGDCIITNAELADLQTVIAHGPYDPLMDCDCDGEINNTELSKFMINMAQQPSCGRGMLGGGGGFGEEWPLFEGEPMFDWPLFDEWVPYEDVPELAAWVAEELSPEDLAATVEALTAAAVEFADTPVGYDIAELLSYLE